jgi:hypothetical protein
VGIVEVVRVSMGGKVESALTSDSGMSNAVDIFGRRTVQRISVRRSKRYSSSSEVSPCLHSTISALTEGEISWGRAAEILSNNFSPPE